MLWDSIYEFFVVHVFGGFLADDDSILASMGAILDTSDNTLYPLNTNQLYFDGFKWSDGGELYPCAISLGNYLSLISTIITMVIILVLIGLFIKKMVSSVSHLMSR